MRKTKIVCTLGPATDREGILAELLKAGMNVARFNFSHGTHEEHKARLAEVRRVSKELNIPVATMLDTRGPEIRLCHFKEGSVELKKGQTFTLTTEDIMGDETICSVTYLDLPKDVKPGDTILLDDGLVRLTAKENDGTRITCTVENDGLMKDQKGINVPTSHLTMPYLSKQDRSDILFGTTQSFDYIAASFIRSAQDVKDIRELLNMAGSSMKIIAKIENREGINNLAEILEAADGIMVARGDMGVEIDFTELPMIQKDMIHRCLAAGKPVITATQMLDSMMDHPRPTRAEITDVANAIYDGTSAVMLSGETAAGKYPVESVETMAAIAKQTENDIKRHRVAASQKEETKVTSIAQATAHAACTTASDLGASCIITVSHSGATAKLVSQFHPDTPVVACLLTEEVQRQMTMYWGITPLLMPYAKDTDELLALAIKTAKDAGLIESGDLVVLTAGVPVGTPGNTNMIKIQFCD